MKSLWRKFALAASTAVAILLVQGCGGGESTPPPRPTATISASTSAVVLGNSVTLTWSSANANSCTASATPTESDWSGAKGASGSQSVSPQAVGTSMYSLTCSGAGGSASASAQETVQPVIQLTNSAPPGGMVGAAYAGSGFALTASGGVSPYKWSWVAATGSSLPVGLTLATNGMISGTPTTAGTYNVVVTVKDSQSTPAQNTAPYTINVAPGLAIASGTPPTGYTYNPYAHRLECSGPPFGCKSVYGFLLKTTGGVGPVSWSWAGTNGSPTPPGLTVRIGYYPPSYATQNCYGNVWQICGLPTTVGTYDVVVTATDSATPPNQVSANYTIKISNPPPPTIAGTIPPIGVINLPYSFAFKTTGLYISPKPLTWGETGPLPPGLTFSTDGVLSGTPTATGSFPITLTVTDALGQSSAAKDFTIVVAAHGFAATGSMSVPRNQHTATLLNTGKVLIAGGTDAGGVAQATAELYDPSTGTFTATGSMTTPRYAFAATLLNNGKVLITGGLDASANTLISAELYDPSTGTFTATSGTMVAPHSAHTATLLKTGKVLITGYGNTNAELFDPNTGLFTPTGSLSEGRVFHTATLLNDGKVLITGGIQGLPPNTTVLSEAELYDPNTGTFTTTMHAMNAPRQLHTASLLGDGTVLITGGLADDAAAALATAEIFDPSNQTFTVTTGPMATARYIHTATVLEDGTVLVCGGGDGVGAVSSAEVYDPAAKTFSATGAMTTIRANHAATKLANGRVLVTGGNNSTPAVAELYQ